MFPPVASSWNQPPCSSLHRRCRAVLRFYHPVIEEWIPLEWIGLPPVVSSFSTAHCNPGALPEIVSRCLRPQLRCGFPGWHLAISWGKKYRRSSEFLPVDSGSGEYIRLSGKFDWGGVNTPVNPAPNSRFPGSFHWRANEKMHLVPEYLP